VPPAPAALAAPAAPTASGETVVAVEDDGKTFTVARGAAVTFRLASQSGTGYVWLPTQVDAAVLAQQGDRTSDVATDTPGAPKFDVYHFTAGAAGSTVVEMSLKRPFGSAPPSRVIHVTVHVR
jgi:predicted secreted protein